MYSRSKDILDLLNIRILLLCNHSNFKILFEEDKMWVRKGLKSEIIDHRIIIPMRSRSANSEVGIKNYDNFSKLECKLELK